MRLDSILEKWVENSLKNERLKNGIPKKIHMDLKNINSNGGNVAERNSKSMQFVFLENC
jgi:hypothetical protein